MVEMLKWFKYKNYWLNNKLLRNDRKLTKW